MANGSNPLLPGGTGPTPNQPDRRINLPSNPPSGGGNGLMALNSGPDNTDMPATRPPGMPQTRQPGAPRSAAEEMEAQHDYAKSVYQSVTKARNLIDHVRREMDQLVRKGDTVTPEDIMAAAGRVVGNGVGAREMATLLADMPTQAGQGLAAWLAQHDASITQQEQHVNMVQSVAASRMAGSAFRLLALEHMMQRSRERAGSMGSLSPRPTAAPPGMAPQGPPNPLTSAAPSAPAQDESEGQGAA